MTKTKYWLFTDNDDNTNNMTKTDNPDNIDNTDNMTETKYWLFSKLSKIRLLRLAITSALHSTQYTMTLHNYIAFKGRPQYAAPQNELHQCHTYRVFWNLSVKIILNI